jgi:peptide deformylase
MSEEEAWGEEGCLSFPGIYGEVLRSESVVVEATDLEGELLRVEASAFFARVLQHEIDHLEGKLFIEKMKPEDREKNRALLKEMEDRFRKPKGAAESTR